MAPTKTHRAINVTTTALMMEATLMTAFEAGIVLAHHGLAHDACPGIAQGLGLTQRAEVPVRSAPHSCVFS